MRWLCIIFCTFQTGLTLEPPSTIDQELPHELPGLHNLMQLSKDVYSGSEPEGEEAFESLQKLGIWTIVSVDGTTPQVAMARKYGIRYIHIPFGYDAIPQAAQLSLTRVARESKSPLYIHCHHGKHRGPAAVAIICHARGITDTAGGLAIMQKAGTSRDYRGLWRDVEQYAVPSADTIMPALVEIAEVESLPAAMARIDRIFDNLKLCAALDWKTPAAHPDLVPAQEALQLRESLHEINRQLSEEKHVADYDDTFRKWLTESDAGALQLYESLKTHDTANASASLASLQKSCQQCHAAYRD